ncbi:MAG: metallophosphoesterase family protein [Candidatus Dormibacteraceae bacterium]
MKIAVVSDIHSNWSALEAVLADMPAVSEVICLGDVVGYGADPIRCVDLVREKRWPTLVGNHDRACTDVDILEWFNEDAARAIEWTVARVGQDRLSWLAALPDTDQIGDEILLVHGSPRDHIYEYILDAPTAEANLALINGQTCFHGHTHVPGIFRKEDSRLVHEYRIGTFRLGGSELVNPGSVGQPRDGNPDASYAIWDRQEGTVEFRRCAYDREAAKAAIREARLPERFAERLDAGR